MELIRWYDYILFLIFLISAIIVFNIYGRKYKSPVIRKYFLWGLVLKLLSSQAYVHLYVYYYTYGDTIRFFRFGQHYKELLTEIQNLSFWEWLTMPNYLFKDYISYKIDYAYGFAESSFVINKLSAFSSFLSFNSFLVNSAFFSLGSYIGLWGMYQVLIKLYPKIYKELALAILFFPSVLFWGSGLMKDTVCIGAIGFMTMSFCRLFILPEKTTLIEKIIYISLFLFGSYMVLNVKTYQLVAYLSGAFLWLFYNYRDKIKNDFLRVAITPILLGVAGLSIILGLQMFSQELDKYALENVVDTALSLSANLGKQDAGSAYDLGAMDPSIAGLLSKFPAAVNVTLFRPYPWEANNVVMIITSIESLLVLLLTMYIVFKVGFFNFFKNIFGSGILMFCFVFTVIFAFAVGLSSSNFGSLVRYKIPLMPFYISGLFILYHNVFNTSFFEDIKKKRAKKQDNTPLKKEVKSN